MSSTLKKKMCALPRAMLLSYNNDILQSRNRDESGKYHDIMTCHGASWQRSEFQGKFSEGIFFPKY